MKDRIFQKFKEIRDLKLDSEKKLAFHYSGTLPSLVSRCLLNQFALEALELIVDRVKTDDYWFK